MTKPLTWLDVFKEPHAQYNVNYDWELKLKEQGLLLCFLCGAVVHEKRDWLHIQFHEDLRSANGNRE